jgi:hypothetical protein
MEKSQAREDTEEEGTGNPGGVGYVINPALLYSQLKNKIQ